MLYDSLDDEELMTVQGFGDYGDYGALYQAPDGTLYQVQGFEEPSDGSLYEAQRFDDALGSDAVPGEVRQGPDGQLYQWVEGYDGLGDPVGFWSLIPSIAKTVLPVVASKVVPRLRRFLPQALRSLRQIAPVMSAVPPMSVVQPMPVVQPTPAAQPTPVVQQAPIVQPTPEQPAPAAADTSDDLTGFGALYQAPDGSLYQLQDVADEPQLAEDEVVQGLYEDERYGDDEELRDVEGYIRSDGEGGCCCPGIRGVDAYVPPQPPRTPPFVRPAVAPDMWRPIW